MIKKSIIIIMCMILFTILLVGCNGKNKNYLKKIKKYNCIDSSVDYSVKAPLSTDQKEYEIHLNIPFYRLYSGHNYLLDSLSEQNTYVIGDEVEIIGKNVETLNGATVSVFKSKLAECIDYESFCQRLAYAIGVEYYNRELEEGIDADKYELVKGIVSDIGDDYTVLTMNISFNGCIYDDIIIEGLEIESLDFIYKFDNFSISTIKYEDLILANDTDVIDYSASVEGVFADARLSEVGYLEIEGDVKENIDEIEVKSLDSDYTVITSSNYDSFQELENKYGIVYESVPAKYNAGDSIFARYVYVCNAPLDDTDAKIVNIYIGYKIKNGTTVCKFVYQPMIVDGPYLIKKMIAECISEKN